MTVGAAPTGLDVCAQEPIRIPGGIQPHGALLVLHPTDLRMLHASTNLFERTGIRFSPDDTRWATGGASQLHGELSTWLGDTERSFLRTIELGQGAIQVNAHRSPQGILV